VFHDVPTGGQDTSGESVYSPLLLASGAELDLDEVDKRLKLVRERASAVRRRGTHAPEGDGGSLVLLTARLGLRMAALSTYNKWVRN
jgi:hypothetical protein